MGKEYARPLTQAELNGAADAAAAIVTRCSMEPERAFVNATSLFGVIQRPSARGSITFDGIAVEAE